MKKKISDKDKKDWENFLNKNEKLFNKDKDNFQVTTENIKYFDLHGYSLDEANIKIKKVIKEAFKNKVKKLVVITGKGIHSNNEMNPYISKNLGILKYSVPNFIREDVELMEIINEIKDVEDNEGGSGAFYISFKKKLQNKL